MVVTSGSRATFQCVLRDKTTGKGLPYQAVSAKIYGPSDQGDYRLLDTVQAVDVADGLYVADWSGFARYGRYTAVFTPSTGGDVYASQQVEDVIWCDLTWAANADIANSAVRAAVEQLPQLLPSYVWDAQPNDHSNPDGYGAKLFSLDNGKGILPEILGVDIQVRPTKS